VLRGCLPVSVDRPAFHENFTHCPLRPSAEQRIYALAKAIVRALQPGNGRSSRCEAEDELRSRLAEGGWSTTRLIYQLGSLPTGEQREGGYDPGAPSLAYILLRFNAGLGLDKRETARNVNEKVPRLAAAGDFIHSASTRFGSGTSSALWH
jgi:hypothetical protein